MKQLAHLVFLLVAAGAADSATHVWLERNSDAQNNFSFEALRCLPEELWGMTARNVRTWLAKLWT